MTEEQLMPNIMGMICGYFCHTEIKNGRNISLLRYVNHSCNPNCVIQQIQSDNDFHLVLIAKQDIKKGLLNLYIFYILSVYKKKLILGEELSFDYNMQEGSGRDVPICRCGESNCTRILSADQEIKRAMCELN